VIEFDFTEWVKKAAGMPKVGFVSLGCPKNLVDSEVMMGILARHGYEITPRADEADVLVVNTCSFIAPAQQESINSILEMAEYKKFGRARRLVVAGCLVERYRDDIREQIPEVDAVIGTGELEQIVEACALETPADHPQGANREEGLFAPDASGLRTMDATHELPTYLYHDMTPRILATPRHTAYIKINEGCDHPCTFCIIPQLRGRFRSRRFESVVREATNLAQTGVREITLIGQDTTYYGEDLGLRDGLPLLLERLAEIPDLHWVRFLYCYPNRITPRLLETIAKYPRLAKYLDIPLQHASRSVLARMHRGSNGDAFLKMLERIRKTIPGVALRTSFIVGFPGETEEDFQILCDFVRAAEFDWLGVFAYSDEDSAKSFHLDDKAEAKTIARRRDKLMAIQKKISARKLRARIGQRVPAMLEGFSKETDLVWEARLEGMAPEIDGKVYITEIEGASEENLPAPGTLATVEITEAHDYDLVGRVVDYVAAPTPQGVRLTSLTSASANYAIAGPSLPRILHSR
jgi:ribosomal protein S12 methylthiotransferase